MLNQNKFCPFEQHNVQPFKTVYDELFKPVYDFCSILLKDDEKAKDLTQETFLKLWNSKEVFETEENIKYFLFRVARNACLNELKYDQRQLLHIRSLTIDNEAATPQACGARMEAETIHELRKAIKLLSPKQQRFTKLWFYEERSPDEIANTMKISIRSVYRLRKSTIQKLQELLQHNFSTIMIIMVLSGHCSAYVSKKTFTILTMFQQIVVFMREQ